MNAPVKTATLQTLRNPPPAEAAMPMVSVGFGSLQSFELTQRIAKMFYASTLVPVAYRYYVESKTTKGTWEENPSALSNCCIAINMAERLHADPLMVMQNLHIIEGRPGWSSVWIIASINQCGRFEPLRFDMSPLGEPQDVPFEYTEWEDGPNGKRRPITKSKTVKLRDRTCIAWTVPKGTIVPQGVNTLAKAKAAGLTVYESTPVSMDLAVKEGWYQRKGSKWQTMSDQMLVYRSASFFGRVYAPELLLGLPSEDEVRDILTARRNDAGTFEVMDLEDLRHPPAGAMPSSEDEDPGTDDDPGTTVDTTTGEIKTATADTQAEPQKQTDGPTDREAFEEAMKLAKAGKYEDAQAVCPPAHSKELQETIDAELERRTAANRQDKGMPPRDATPTRSRGR